MTASVFGASQEGSFTVMFWSGSVVAGGDGSLGRIRRLLAKLILGAVALVRLSSCYPHTPAGPLLYLLGH